MANRNTRVSRSTLSNVLRAAAENTAPAQVGGEDVLARIKADVVEVAAEEVVTELPELVPAQEAVASKADELLQEIKALEAALVPDVANPEGVPPQEQPATPKAGPVLHVKQGLSLRGGRGEWYKLLCKYDGKPVSDYLAEGKANPASHYTARSVKCGQPKTPESRLSWFKRAGIVTITD